MTIDRLRQALCIELVDAGFKVVEAANGEEALAHLRDAKSSRPFLILLDINMPKMNGIELLKVMKEDDKLKTIPVVMLTTSTNDRDIIQSFHLSVAGYMVKPVDYQEFVETMRTVEAYWRLSLLPA